MSDGIQLLSFQTLDWFPVSFLSLQLSDMITEVLPFVVSATVSTGGVLWNIISTTFGMTIRN